MVDEEWYWDNDSRKNTSTDIKDDVPLNYDSDFAFFCLLDVPEPSTSFLFLVFPSSRVDFDDFAGPCTAIPSSFLSMSISVAVTPAGASGVVVSASLVFNLVPMGMNRCLRRCAGWRYRSASFSLVDSGASGEEMGGVGRVVCAVITMWCSIGLGANFGVQSHQLAWSTIVECTSSTHLW